MLILDIAPPHTHILLGLLPVYFSIDPLNLPLKIWQEQYEESELVLPNHWKNRLGLNGQKLWTSRQTFTCDPPTPTPLISPLNLF